MTTGLALTLAFGLAAPAALAAGAAKNCDGTLQVLPRGEPDERSFSLVLSYQDFGPQSMAGKLLGDEAYQWSGSLNDASCRDARFDVRVVVYRKRSLAAVKARFPTIKGQADYRYVELAAARAFLAQAAVDAKGIPALEATLAATAKTLKSAFP